MTIKIEEQIQRMTNTAVQKELSKLSQVVVKPSLTEIVSVGYERWVQLIDAYSSTGKRDRYKYLAGVLTENFDIEVKPETLRKTISVVRKRRGERVFKKGGAPFNNLHWGTV